jgi:hypothetical protein
MDEGVLQKNDNVKGHIYDSGNHVGDSLVTTLAAGNGLVPIVGQRFAYQESRHDEGGSADHANGPDHPANPSKLRNNKEREVEMEDRHLDGGDRRIPHDICRQG